MFEFIEVMDISRKRRSEVIKNNDGIPFRRYTTKSSRDGTKRKANTFKLLLITKDDDIL